jgi:hypothetical protein
VAPWNVMPAMLHTVRDDVFVGPDPLIFFHFHGLKQIGRWLFDPAWKEYGIEPSATLRRLVYLPYIRTLADVNRNWLRSSGRAPIPAGLRFAKERSSRASGLRRAVASLRAVRTAARDIASGTLILFVNRFAI